MTSGPAGVMVCGREGEVAQLQLGSMDPHHETSGIVAASIQETAGLVSL